MAQRLVHHLEIKHQTTVGNNYNQLYTPSSDEVGTFSIEKTQGQVLNIDRIRIICTTCPENAKVYDFKRIQKKVL